MLETNRSELGVMKLTEEVLAIVAGIAALEVEGVAAMSGGFTGGIVDILGKKNFARGVEINFKDRSIDIYLNINVELGANIPAVTKDIQKKVRIKVNKITGAAVDSVNVNIEGVS